MLRQMADDLSLGEAAKQLGVSVDTLRRWDRDGKLQTSRDANDRRRVPVAEVERLRSSPQRHRTGDGFSARNRFEGTVVSVESDGVMALVEIESGPHRITAAITHAAWQAAFDADVSAILCCTSSGLTARAMARFRPKARLIGVSHNPRTVDLLTLSWGVESLHVANYTTVDETVWFAVEGALSHGMIDHGDTVLVLAGAPQRGTGGTDVLRIVRVV